MLHACPNLISLSLDLCSFLEPISTPYFNKILRETHFSQIERLEVRVDEFLLAQIQSEVCLLCACSLLYPFVCKVTGEVPSNISSLLLLRSGRLRHLHLSRPPVSLLEELLAAGPDGFDLNVFSICQLLSHIKATSATSRCSPPQVRSSP